MDEKFIMGENVLYAISLVVQIFSIIIIGRYDPSHSSRPILCPTSPDNNLWAASWETCRQLKNYPSVLASYVFDDPSLAAFDGALAMFTLAALYLYSFHREDRYQNHLLLAGIVAAAVTSSTRCSILFDEPLTRSIQICLPTSIMVGSVVSAIIHRTGLLATSRAHDQEWEQRKEIHIGGQEKSEK